MRRIRLPVIFFAVFCASSCGKMLLPPLTIISISPAPGLIDPESTLGIEVAFSASPTPESAEKGFSLWCEGSRMDGILSVMGNALRFAPRAGFSPGKEYTMTIGETIETRDGISIQDELTIDYTTRSESVPPTIVGVSPENGAELLFPPDHITFTFSEPVATDSLSRALSVSPQVNKILTLSADGLSATLIPIEPLALGTRYTLKVSADLRDRAGNPLGKEYVSSFLCGTDRVAPTYVMTAGTVSMTPGVTASVSGPDSMRIVMAFDEPLADNAAMGRIVVQPPLRISVTQEVESAGTIASIELNETPVWGEEYALFVRKGIADVSGNAIGEDVEYRFVRDHERERPLTPIKAYLDVGRGIAESRPRYASLSPAESYGDLVLPAEAWPTDVPVTACMYVFARGSAESTGITRASAMRCASLDATNSCLTVKIARVETGLAAGTLCEPIRDLVAGDADLSGGEGALYVIKIDLEVTNRDNRGLIKVGIAKGLRDGIGNETDTDWSVTMDKS